MTAIFDPDAVVTRRARAPPLVHGGVASAHPQLVTKVEGKTDRLDLVYVGEKEGVFELHLLTG